MWHELRLTAQKNSGAVVTEMLLEQVVAERIWGSPAEWRSDFCARNNRRIPLSLALLSRTCPISDLISETPMAPSRSNCTIPNLPTHHLPAASPDDPCELGFVRGEDQFKHGPDDFSYLALQITASDSRIEPSTDSRAEFVQRKISQGRDRWMRLGYSNDD